MTSRPDAIQLGIGDLYFGRAQQAISTVLGSCVAVTLWHPARRVAGMCHVQLPDPPAGRCDNRYAECVVGRFLHEAARLGTRPSEYRVGLYGGGDMFPGQPAPERMRVGSRNVDRMRELLDEAGFHVDRQEVGGPFSRRIEMDPLSGEVSATLQDVRPYLSTVTKGVS